MTPSEVKRIRKRLGLSQEGLAQALGVTASSVARWEQGVIGMRESAARLLQVLAGQRPAGKLPRRRRG